MTTSRASGRPGIPPRTSTTQRRRPLGRLRVIGKPIPKISRQRPDLSMRLLSGIGALAGCRSSLWVISITNLQKLSDPTRKNSTFLLYQRAILFTAPDKKGAGTRVPHANRRPKRRRSEKFDLLLRHGSGNRLPPPQFAARKWIGSRTCSSNTRLCRPSS